MKVPAGISYVIGTGLFNSPVIVLFCEIVTDVAWLVYSVGVVVYFSGYPAVYAKKNNLEKSVMYSLELSNELKILRVYVCTPLTVLYAKSLLVTLPSVAVD